MWVWLMLCTKTGWDISHAVQQHVEAEGFAIITNFVGHGVGRTHEDPQIPNFGRLERDTTAQNGDMHRTYGEY